MSTKSGCYLGVIVGLLAIGLILLSETHAQVAKPGDQNKELIEAARKGRLEKVTNLLKSGADVNAKDEEGRTALGMAQEKEHKEIESLLEAHGAQTAEDQQLAKFGDKVARRGGELFFRLKDGRIISRRSTPTGPPDEPDRYEDSTGDPNVGHALDDLIDPWYVIREGYYEDWATEFINRDTGAVKGVQAKAKFSPDKTRFIAIEYQGAAPCDTEVWKLSRVDVVREWILERACEYSYRWSDPSTFEALSPHDGKNYEPVARLKLEGASWTCSGSSKVCKTIKFATPIDNGDDDDLKDLPGPMKLMMEPRERLLAVVKELSVRGLDINAPIGGCDTALTRAAGQGLLEMVKLVLDKGADVNANMESCGAALQKASEEGHLEVVKLLLDSGADVNAKGTNRWPALIWAASRGQWGVVTVLLEKGADINAQKHFGQTALAKAGRDGHIETVRVLLDKGVDIRAEHGWPALQMAAGEGRLEVVKLLLDRGADVNAKDEAGRTALMSAAIRGQVEVVNLLLDKGANVDARDKDGSTALMDAAWGGNPEVARLLLDKRADVKPIDKDGKTALMWAAEPGRPEVVKLLLEKGADPNAKTKFGRTALKIAQERSHTEIVELLKAHGVKE